MARLQCNGLRSMLTGLDDWRVSSSFSSLIVQRWSRCISAQETQPCHKSGIRLFRSPSLAHHHWPATTRHDLFFPILKKQSRPFCKTHALLSSQSQPTSRYPSKNVPTHSHSPPTQSPLTLPPFPPNNTPPPVQSHLLPRQHTQPPPRPLSGRVPSRRARAAIRGVGGFNGRLGGKSDAFAADARESQPVRGEFRGVSLWVEYECFCG
jgi:hypothetical protein